MDPFACTTNATTTSQAACATPSSRTRRRRAAAAAAARRRRARRRRHPTSAARAARPGSQVRHSEHTWGQLLVLLLPVGCLSCTPKQTNPRRHGLRRASQRGRHLQARLALEHALLRQDRAARLVQEGGGALQLLGGVGGSRWSGIRRTGQAAPRLCDEQQCQAGTRFGGATAA